MTRNISHTTILILWCFVVPIFEVYKICDTSRSCWDLIALESKDRSRIIIIRAEARRILKKARQKQNRELVLQEASKERKQCR